MREALYRGLARFCCAWLAPPRSSSASSSAAQQTALAIEQRIELYDAVTALLMTQLVRYVVGDAVMQAVSALDDATAPPPAAGAPLALDRCFDKAGAQRGVEPVQVRCARFASACSSSDRWA